MTDTIDPSDGARRAYPSLPTHPAAVGPSFARDLLVSLLRFKDGEFSSRIATDFTGVEGKIADVFNEVLAMSARRADEIWRVCRVVGKEGKLKQRMSVPGAVGGWSDEIVALNTLIEDLAWPTTEVTRAIGAVAKGDLGQAMALDVDGRSLEGEFLRSAQLVNKMIRRRRRAGRDRRGRFPDGCRIVKVNTHSWVRYDGASVYVSTGLVGQTVGLQVRDRGPRVVLQRAARRGRTGRANERRAHPLRGCVAESASAGCD